MLGDEMLIAMWHLQNVFRNAVMKKFSLIVHSKKCWVVLTQFWVKYGQTRNVWLKM